MKLSGVEAAYYHAQEAVNIITHLRATCDIFPDNCEKPRVRAQAYAEGALEVITSLRNWLDAYTAPDAHYEITDEHMRTYHLYTCGRYWSIRNVAGKVIGTLYGIADEDDQALNSACNAFHRAHGAYTLVFVDNIVPSEYGVGQKV